MQLEDVKPNEVTVVSVLRVCAHLGALNQGSVVRDYIRRRGFVLDVFVGTSFVDMYAKCGRIDFARQVFDKILERDAVSWSAMIAGYGMHGYVEDALKLFEQMQKAAVKPDHITFVSVLSSCTHAGLVN